MKHKSLSCAMLALVATFGWSQVAEAVVTCWADSKADNPSDPIGDPTRWPTMPVKYKINAAIIPETTRATVVSEVQAAFDAYNQILCTSLQFSFDGETESLSSVGGEILIQFLDDAHMSGGGYLQEGQQKASSEGKEWDFFTISLNTKYFGVGQDTSKIDIQTALIQMIPMAVGIYVGTPNNNAYDYQELKFNYVNHSVSQEQTEAIQWLYFKEGESCTKPSDPPACRQVELKFDGKQHDGGVIPSTGDGGGTQPTYQDSSIINSYSDGGSISNWSDSGYQRPTQSADDGCCRVSSARTSTAESYLLLVGLGIVTFIFLRRRK